MSDFTTRKEKTGETLRLLRKKSGLSLKEMGQIMGVSYQQVQKYESGVNRLPLSLLPDLCDLFGVSAETFLGTETRSVEADEDVLAVCLAMRAIPTRDLRHKIRRVVEILVA